MKKHLLYAFVLTMFVGAVYAQLPVSTSPQNKTAYLEEFTGIRCGYCPDGHRIGTQIHDADPNRVVLVNIHAGGFATVNGAGHAGQPDFTTGPGTAIDGMSGMGITGYPAGNVNRHVFSGTAMAAGRSSWAGMVNNIKAQPAYCNVACQGTLDPVTRVLTVDVEVYYTNNGAVSTNSLNVFILESKIPGYQSNYGTPVYYNIANYNEDGTYNHNHVLRTSLTGDFGVTIPNTSSTTLFTTQLTYTIPATYGVTNSTGPHTTVPNLGNLSLVAFVAQTDREVINAADGPITLTSDAKAKAIDFAVNCGSNLAPVITVQNSGLTTITDLTITPSVDNVIKTPTIWNGTLAGGASTTVTLNNLGVVSGGGHLISYSITGDFYTGNNSGKGSYYTAADFSGTPISEGFSITVFPPTSWAVKNADNGASWSRKQALNIGAYNESSHCVKYDFFKNTVIGDKDELYLPPMDLSGADDPEISFDIAYLQRTYSSNDALEVMVSSDCGATWTTVYSSAGSALTNSSPMGTEFTQNPPDASLWKTEVAILPGFNKSNVIAKFVTTNDNGNNLYLDNVNLLQKNLTGLSKTDTYKMSVSLFPNPSNGLTNIKFNSAKAGEASISVMNTLGQVVCKKQSTLTEGYNSVELNVANLANGIYTVSIETAGGTAVKKLNVNK